VNQLPVLEDDGFLTPAAGTWAEQKYLLLYNYASMFATSMKRRWEHRVYVDLFSGAGRARMTEPSRVVPASPMLALMVPDPFDRYVFCEISAEKIHALRLRCKREYPAVDVRFVHGNSNECVEEILSEFPLYGPRSRVLGFCFADVQAMSNMDFETVVGLARRYMDFLILIPTGMEATRWWRDLLLPRSDRVARFTGVAGWRDRWAQAEASGASVDGFLTELYHEQMKTLGYVHGGFDHTTLIRLPGRNVRLYRLAFFSRHRLGEWFWRQTQKSSTRQLSLLDGLTDGGD
jgi:three-Cys-motif partner protein